MTPRSLRHRAPLLALVLPWIVGSALAHHDVVPDSPIILATIAFACLGLAWAAMLTGGKGTRLVLGSVAVALVAAGALRTTHDRSRPGEWDALGLPPREALVTLRVERLFATREPDRSAGIARVVAAAPHLRDVTGQRISFSITLPDGVSPPARGAEFGAVGVLAPLPRDPPPASFERALADLGANFSFDRARLEGGITPAGPWRRFCTAGEARLERVLRAGLAHRPELADLYVAMLLGKKQALSPEQKDAFVRSGTMHLFAVSGLHIAAIGLAVQTLLTLVRLPGRARFLAGTAILWIYVEITGSEPSAVRAFWMLTCLFGARQIRAPSNGLSALAASALVVLLLDPHQLFTAGFQLSYGIVSALLLYGAPLQERWHEGWRPWSNLPSDARDWRHHTVDYAGRAVLGALALGIAATLVSTPATLGFFGLLAPAGFLVNLVLIPVSSLVLFAGLAALLAGLAGLTPLAVLFNHAAAFTLAVMEVIVECALRIPGASWPASFDPPVLAIAGSAGMLAMLGLGYALGWSPRFGGYWLPAAALALLLALGLGDAPVAP
ncbi:MAG: hypothetical protein RLZZ50_1665 [Verrucomicrobiota bacterium]